MKASSSSLSDEGWLLFLFRMKASSSLPDEGWLILLFLMKDGFFFSSGFLEKRV
jgi:hypothetical protein